MGYEIDFDRRRFKELVLFIAEHSQDDPRFGATKLNKILYFSDFKAFALHGAPITGATYRRLERGPAPLEMLDVLNEMQHEGDISITERRYFNRRQRWVRAERKPDLTALAPHERELVALVIQELRYAEPLQVPALSHLEVNWQVARELEVIPYSSAYISDRRPTAREVLRRKQAVDGQRAERSP